MHAAPPVQVLDRACPPTADRMSSRRRRSRAAALVAVPVLAGTVLPAVAAAQDYQYTGECSLYQKTVNDKKLYRAYRARFLRSDKGTDWGLGGYDYTYSIDDGLSWGPHSDERVEYDRGHTAGPASWHSPDDHTSNVAWVPERGWKGGGDKGGTVLQVHAWFDKPSANDPECDVYTARF